MRQCSLFSLSGQALAPTLPQPLVLCAPGGAAVPRGARGIPGRRAAAGECYREARERAPEVPVQKRASGILKYSGIKLDKVIVGYVYSPSIHATGAFNV